MTPSLAKIVEDSFRVLTFRKPSPAIGEHWKSYLVFGLLFTWLCGMGRYWDNPKSSLWQTLGLGSLGYVFILALILWAIIYPLGPKRWSYRIVLVFVTLTSPPALLYAIPVEQFMPLLEAQKVNAWFLGIVATWRVALLGWFLRTSAGLRGGAIVVATLLPLALIVCALAVLNLEHVVFNIMAGIKPGQRSPNDLAYGIVAGLAFWSFFAAPFLAMAYAWYALSGERDT